jgi:hypothetical protein
MEFDTGELHKNLLRDFNFGQNRTKVMSTLHKELHAFLLSEVTAWAIHLAVKFTKVKRQNLAYIPELLRIAYVF